MPYDIAVEPIDETPMVEHPEPTHYASLLAGPSAIELRNVKYEITSKGTITPRVLTSSCLVYVTIRAATEAPLK